MTTTQLSAVQEIELTRTLAETRQAAWDYRMPAEIVTDGLWANLKPSARAVLPALGLHVNTKTRIARPGQKRLSELTGLSPGGVALGLADLERHALIKILPPAEWGGNRKTPQYYVPAPTRNWFSFSGEIIISGVWRNLTPTEKSVYTTLRALGFNCKLEDFWDTANAPWRRNEFYPAWYNACDVHDLLSVFDWEPENRPYIEINTPQYRKKIATLAGIKDRNANRRNIRFERATTGLIFAGMLMEFHLGGRILCPLPRPRLWRESYKALSHSVH